MKITIENTSKLVFLTQYPNAEGVSARIWEGETETGIKVKCYITLISIDADEPRAAEFDKELIAVREPSKETQLRPNRLTL